MVELRHIIDLELIESGAVIRKPASKLKRLANLLIDYIGSLAFGFIFGITLNLTGWDKIIASTRIAKHDFFDIVLGLSIIFLYYLFTENLFRGKSLGKFITKTSVINQKGDPPTFLQVLNRTIFRFIPFEPFSLLFSKSQSWHDKLSGTFVVDDWQ